MNPLQACELDILLEVDRVCRENNIRYFLCCGTLLGAIRHQGFIPWDDDVDIVMFAEDFWRFMEIAPKAFGKDYFLQSTDTDLWYKAFLKVRKNHTTMIETCYENLKFHQGVWIDIFPIFSYTNDEKTLKKINRKLTFSNLLMQDAFNAKSENVPVKLKLLQAVPIQLRRSLCKRIRKRVIKTSRSITNCEYYWGFPVRKSRLKLTDFLEEIRVPFEGYMLPVPKGYDSVLTDIYGDYMTPPPPDKRDGGHSIEVLDLENDYTHYIP